MKTRKRIRNIIFGIIVLFIGTSLIPCICGGVLDYNQVFLEDMLQFATPPTPIRNIAEFEPMKGVLIRYPFGISYELIAEMSEDVEVVTIVANTYQQNYVYSQYQNHGVNVDHCSFLIALSDTYWTRDYGPWFAFTGNDELAVIDFSFYGYGNYYPNDNNIPSAFAVYQNFPQYFMPLYHEGGNYMTDGHGISASTDMLWSINPNLTPEEIIQIAQDYLGIDYYHVVSDPNGEWLDHIDCWGKFLAPDVIMIREVPTSHPQYGEIEATATYFANQLSCYGTLYKIARVYTPNNQPYTNSLILNDKVLVPMTGGSWDDEAIKSYEDAMPGYEVLGFTGSWYSFDALHCRTIGIPDRGMLYIEHTPLTGNQPSENGYDIQAKIYPYSEQNLITASTGVFWSINSGSWNFIQMQPAGDAYYYAIIPPQQNGTVVSYYIHAEDESGRAENHPYIGEADAHSFTAYGDIETNTPPEQPQKPTGETSGDVETTYTYMTQTTDNDGDQVYYLWDWGDGTFSDWLGPFASGLTITAQHSWSVKGTYSIRVKAKDVHDADTNWSEPLAVTMPCSYNLPFMQFWIRLFERFPHAFPLLRQLLWH